MMHVGSWHFRILKCKDCAKKHYKAFNQFALDTPKKPIKASNIKLRDILWTKKFHDVMLTDCKLSKDKSLDNKLRF